MKAIILAAGMGTRLGEHTHHKPKGMVELMGKPLIQHQLETLRAVGIEDIVIVRGYKGEKIDFRDVRYVHNPDFANSNMIESLRCAVHELRSEVLVLYADILYEPRLLLSLVDTHSTVSVNVDIDFHDYWQARTGSLSEDSESLCFDAQGFITEIGFPNPAPERMQGRYIGMIKFNQQGCDEFRRHYERLRSLHSADERPWRNSPSFRRGFMTDFLQELIDQKVEVRAVPVRRGWLEVDTVRDLERYNHWIKTGEISRLLKHPQRDKINPC